jgi:uncharacterized protein (UPF0335 family)
MTTSDSSLSDIEELIHKINRIDLTEDTSITTEIEEIRREDASNKFKVKMLTSLLKRLEAENREKQEREARIIAENREIELISKEIEQNGVGFLKVRGLPSLRKPNLSVSSPCYGKHDPITSLIPEHIDNINIGIPLSCRIENLPDKSSEIWRSARGSPRQLGNWNCEMNIEAWTRLVFEDVIALLNLTEKIILSNQVTITLIKHLIPDILFFEVNGRLIGVCEVKEPTMSGKNQFKDLETIHPQLINQILNYLLQLMHTHGVQQPIGIITTYNEWRVCFLRESYDYVIAEDSPESYSHAKGSTFPAAEEGKIQLLTSKVYRFDDPSLIEVLAATISKIYHVQVEPPTSLTRSTGEPRKFGYVHEDHFTWTILPGKCINALTYDMPTSQTRNFYLIQDFHGGRDGRVWLAVSDLGKVAVVKMSHERTYVKEAEAWKLIWGEKLAYTTTLLSANALVMPFVFHGYYQNQKVTFRPFGAKWTGGECTIDDIYASEILVKFNESLEIYFNNPMNAAKEALTEMAERGYAHRDLAWRHVGLMPYRVHSSSIDTTIWAVKPVLIDLHDVECFRVSCPSDEFKSKVDSIVSAGIERLQEMLNLC